MNDLFHLVRMALTFGRIERGVSHPDGKPETDTDHSISLSWAACSLAEKRYPQLDCGLIAQFAVVHDAPEVYAGDTYAVTVTEATKAIQRERESAAIKRIGHELPELPWLVVMMTRYESQQDPEARFVRAVDKLIPKIVLRIEGDVRARLLLHNVDKQTAIKFRQREIKEMNAYAVDFPEILELRDELNAMLDLDCEYGNDQPTSFTTKTGRILTDQDLETLADEAECGYDFSELKGKKMN